MLKGRGFTLIELVIVIGIIAILAGIILTNFGDVRGGARDSKRISDLQQVKVALEAYYADNKAYPDTGGLWKAGSSACQATFGSGEPGYTDDGTHLGYIPRLAPTYISKLPEDPKGVSANKCYIYKSTGQAYKMLAWGTVEKYSLTHEMADPGWGAAFPTCTNGRTDTYSIYNLPGYCF